MTTNSHNEELATGGLMRFVVLPPHVSDFERSYLARMTRVALWFLGAHVPAMMAVAALAHTGVVRAALFTSFLLLGPLLAMRVLTNPRHVTKVIAVTAMCMAGLLVHFGQGSMQIEMHFYFFVLLALLVVFADPLVIVVAAGSVVVHHVLLYVLLPSSIFNYEASLWTVVVHGAFVIVESVAACFVARNFFGSVIGLEQKVQRRTHQLEARSKELRLMLGAVSQGFLTVDRRAVVQGERSAILDRWLPPCAPGSHVWEYLALADATFGRRFRLGWEALLEDVLPLELTLDQLPKTLVASGLTLEVAYHPVLSGGELEHVVLVLSDVSSRLEQERVEEENADLLAVCEHVADDPAGFRAFLAEADQLVQGIEQPADEDTRQRVVHTLKGNSALFGLNAVARLCHVYEDAMQEGAAPAEAARAALLARWVPFRAKLTTLFGTREAGSIEISEADYAALHGALMGHGRREDALRTLAHVKLEPVATRLQRLGQQAKVLAGQLSKAPLAVRVEAADLRLERALWGPLWGALVHVVHNAVDHGIETATERAERGKSPRASLTLRARLAGDLVELDFSDDGRGVDWDALRERAIDLSLPHATTADLTDAMFASGVSTKLETTTLSGRGVGLGALRALVRRMGGTIAVTSEPGRGTQVSLRIPHDQAPRGASKLVA